MQALANKQPIGLGGPMQVSKLERAAACKLALNILAFYKAN